MFALRAFLCLKIFGFMACSAAALEFQYVSKGIHCGGCDWIQASGTVTLGDAEKFEQFIHSKQIEPLRKHNIVFFNSQGGNLAAGMKLGKTIRKLGFTTGIGQTRDYQSDGSNFGILEESGNCISACAYAFLGGKYRQLNFSSDETCLGFHQFFNPNLLDGRKGSAVISQTSTQLISGLIIEYLNELGADVRLYSFASRFQGEKFGCISKSDSQKFNIDNSTDTFSDWQLVPFAKGIIAEIKALRTNRKARIYCSQQGTHIAFFLSGEYFESLEDIRKGVFEVKFVLNSDTNQTNSNLRLVAKTKDSQNSIVVLDIPEKFAKSLASAKKINASNSHHPRILLAIIDDFEFSLNGDGRSVNLALKNCI